MTDVIEGEAVEVEPVRSVVPVQPGQVIVTDTTPADMLERASAIATALARMVEAQKLYTVIQSRKYPQVEAWQTIGRMDNVVAREASTPSLDESGAWTAEVELVRLSDGMVIGHASAMCGATGDGHPTKHDHCDKPWCQRPTHQRRSMAVTRATSRAFRQQYSWIMALAGYEPTPADEMPHDDAGATETPERRDGGTSGHDGLTGTVTRGKAPVDYDLRYQPDGTPAAGFKLAAGRQGLQVLALGLLAEALASVLPTIEGRTVTVWGSVQLIDWQKDGKDMPPYRRLVLERIQTPDFTLPADEPVEAPSEPMFALSDDEKAAIAGGLT